MKINVYKYYNSFMQKKGKNGGKKSVIQTLYLRRKKMDGEDEKQLLTWS